MVACITLTKIDITGAESKEDAFASLISGNINERARGKKHARNNQQHKVINHTNNVLIVYTVFFSPLCCTCTFCCKNRCWTGQEQIVYLLFFPATAARIEKNKLPTGNMFNYVRIHGIDMICYCETDIAFHRVMMMMWKAQNPIEKMHFTQIHWKWSIVCHYLTQHW